MNNKHFLQVVTSGAIFKDKEPHTDTIITTTHGYNKFSLLCLKINGKNTMASWYFYHCSSSFSCSLSTSSPIGSNHSYANAACWKCNFSISCLSLGRPICCLCSDTYKTEPRWFPSKALSCKILCY